MVRTIAKDYDQKRQNILKAAAQVFATEGFARASMAEVARAGGMSKANIYHYYNSKDALLFDILDAYLSTLRDRLAGLRLDDETPEKQLRLIVRETLLAYQGMDHEHKIQTEGLSSLGEAEQDTLKSYQRDMVRQMCDVLARIAPSRLAHDKSRLRATAMSVFGMLNWFYMWNGEAGAEARREYADLVSDLTISGIRD